MFGGLSRMVPGWCRGVVIVVVALLRPCGCGRLMFLIRRVGRSEPSRHIRPCPCPQPPGKEVVGRSHVTRPPSRRGRYPSSPHAPALEVRSSRSVIGRQLIFRLSLLFLCASLAELCKIGDLGGEMGRPQAKTGRMGTRAVLTFCTPVPSLLDPPCISLCSMQDKDRVWVSRW